MEWLQKNDPFIFEVVKKRADLDSGTGLGALDWGSLFTSAVDTIKNLAPAVISAQGQKKLLDVQIERAKQNLPPLDTSNYMPTVKIAADITPENEEAALRVAQQTINTQVQGMKPYFFGGLALAAFLFFRKRR